MKLELGTAMTKQQAMDSRLELPRGLTDVDLEIFALARLLYSTLA